MILLFIVWQQLSEHMYETGMSKIEELEQQVHGRGRYGNFELLITLASSSSSVPVLQRPGQHG